MGSPSIPKNMRGWLKNTKYVSDWVEINNGKFDIDERVVRAVNKTGDCLVLVKERGTVKVTDLDVEVTDGVPKITSTERTDLEFNTGYLINAATHDLYDPNSSQDIYGQIVVIRGLRAEDIGYKLTQLTLSLDSVKDYEEISGGHFDDICEYYGRSEALTQAVDFMNRNGYRTDFMKVENGLSASDLNTLTKTDKRTGPRLTEERGKSSREKILVSTEDRPKRYLLRSRDEILEQSECTGLDEF